MVRAGEGRGRPEKNIVGPSPGVGIEARRGAWRQDSRGRDSGTGGRQRRRGSGVKGHPPPVRDSRHGGRSGMCLCAQCIIDDWRNGGVIPGFVRRGGGVRLNGRASHLECGGAWPRPAPSPVACRSTRPLPRPLPPLPLPTRVCHGHLTHRRSSYREGGGREGRGADERGEGQMGEGDARPSVPCPSAPPTCPRRNSRVSAAAARCPFLPRSPASSGGVGKGRRRPPRWARCAPASPPARRGVSGGCPTPPRTGAASDGPVVATGCGGTGECVPASASSPPPQSCPATPPPPPHDHPLSPPIPSRQRGPDAVCGARRPCV